MIGGAHTIIFAEDAERARAFLRDVPALAYTSPSIPARCRRSRMDE